MSKDKKPQDKKKTGYKNPPKLGQFKKGVSGNIRGRPRKARTSTIPHPDDMLTRLLAETIKANKGGKPVRISKAEALYASILNAAITGSVSAQKFMMQLIEKLPYTYKKSPSTEMSPGEERMIRQFQKDAESFARGDFSSIDEDETSVKEAEDTENTADAVDQDLTDHSSANKDPDDPNTSGQ